MNNLIKNVGPHPVSSRPFWNKINNFRKPKNPSFGGSIKSGYFILNEPSEKVNLFGSILKETCLIRSVFDYSFFNVNSLAEGTFHKLQVMQNCALRSIFKNWERGGVTEI